MLYKFIYFITSISWRSQTINCSCKSLFLFSSCSADYFTYFLTYSLTLWSRVLLEKLIGSQLVKKFPAFYGIWRFIMSFTGDCHLSLSSVRLIQSMTSHPTSWRSILILSSHLCLGHPTGLFPSSFPTKTLYSPPYMLHAPPISFFSIWSPEPEEWSSLSSSLCSFLHFPVTSQIFSSIPYSQTPSSYVPPPVWRPSFTQFHTHTKQQAKL